ncbi:DUF1553 domain-containing protein [bacterium]|nr:DUF1553 domain-containing protein [bacterium]
MGHLRADDELFEKSIRPLLETRCVKCHGAETSKGGLRLDSKAGWQVGGDGGPAIEPGKPAESRLLLALKGEDGMTRMPPKEPLSTAEIEAISKWIAAGAHDPRVGGPVKLGGTTVDEARRWWAFQPLRQPQVPGNGQRNPIDAFLAVKLAEKGLEFAPKADRRTLIRRATYDLTGLPPKPEEVDAFLADTSPDAFAKVVDRLLSSPHYGERWGRHWLDLVRYADTAGENADFPLPHAWRYRNWVIEAFNRDMPYDTFLKEQLAGDILAAEGPADRYAEKVVATGYLAISRRFEHDSDQNMHLTYEDTIDTLGKSLMGLTIGCARCHDHKYDAITSRDYYSLYGIFASTKYAFPGCEAKPRPRDMVPLAAPAEWQSTIKPHLDELAAIDARMKSTAEKRKAHVQEAQARFEKARHVMSTGEISIDGEKSITDGQATVDVKAGEMILLSITPLKNHGADSTALDFEIAEIGGSGRTWNATKDLLNAFPNGNPAADSHGNADTWWLLDTRGGPGLMSEFVKDLSGKAGLNVWRSGETPSVFVNSSAAPVEVWTRLPARTLFVHPAPDGNVAIGWLSPITGKVNVSGKIRDAHAGGPDGVGWVLEHFASDVREPMIAQKSVSAEARDLIARKTELEKNAPNPDYAYAVIEGQPADARMHLRGDPKKQGDPVPRRWLEVFGGTTVANTKGSGRKELADWIASADNPLTARVMGNRIWLHHFGKGIVPTPNDFGTRGTPPTHPDLLDWLASEFLRNGWKIKPLHRLIMLSDAYRQSADPPAESSVTDPSNSLYSHFERRRLSAEEIRDTILAVSDKLDEEPAGPHPFPPSDQWRFTQHTPFATFYETSKRSIYLVQIRNRRHPFLGLFDGADPNATTPQRQTTAVPTQALFFLNDPFFHEQAAIVADRVLAEPPETRANALFRIVLQRQPSGKDRKFAAGFLDRYAPSSAKDPNPTTADRQAWATLARILMASNEFLFVE